MKLITDFLPHLFLYGFLAFVALAVILPALGLVIIPFHSIIEKINENRCPKCRGFFKRELKDWEVSDMREVLKTVNRLDQGTIYGNGFLEPNHAIEIRRQEQVTFTRKTILNHWVCKDTLCGHEWDTEETHEWEGSLG